MPSDFGLLGATGLPDVGNHARGLPLAVLVDPAMAAAAVARQLDEDLVRDFVREGCTLVGEPGADALHAVLMARAAAERPTSP